MWPYLLIFVLVWAAAYEEYIFRRRRIYYIAVPVLLLFLGLRFETGYDWPAYKELFYELPSIGELDVSRLFVFSVLYGKEPLYLAFSATMKWIWNDFQGVVIVSSIFEIVSFVVFLRRLTSCRATVFAASVTWVIFTLYFSVIRQGISVAFFLLFLLFYFGRRYWFASICLMGAIGFHYSALLYFAIFLFVLLRPSKKLLLVIVLIAGIFGIMGDMAQALLHMAGQVIPIEAVEAKLEWYAERDDESHANIFDQIYALVFSVVMGGVLFSISLEKMSDLKRAMYVIAIIFIAFQLAFLDFPLFRNRLQYLALPFVYIFFFECFLMSKITVRLLVINGLCFITLIYFLLFLSKESSLPFVPYQNYITYALTDRPGDGLNRVERVVDERFGK